MAAKILDDLRQEKFEEVAVAAGEYLRKASVIKKNAKARANFEIFLLKLLKGCTDILERGGHAEKVVPLVELAMEPLTRVRLSPSELPELAFEKVLIHLATRVFACERLATAVDVLQCLHVRVDQLVRGSQPPSSLPSLLEAVHKTVYTCASRLLEKIPTHGPTAESFYLSLLSLYMRFQLLVGNGFETATKRMLSVATSVHQNHPEMFHRFVVTTMDSLSLPSHRCEKGNELHQSLSQWDTYLQLQFHLVSLSLVQKDTETYSLLQQTVTKALSLSGHERKKKDAFESEPVPCSYKKIRNA